MVMRAEFAEGAYHPMATVADAEAIRFVCNGCGAEHFVPGNNVEYAVVSAELRGWKIKAGPSSDRGHTYDLCSRCAGKESA